MGGMFSDLKKLQQAPAPSVPKNESHGNTGTRKPVNPHPREHGNTAIREPVYTGIRDAVRPPDTLDITDRADVKQTYNSSTAEEKAMRRLIFQLNEEHDITTGKQDIQRCGVQLIVENYRKEGANSFIVRTLKQKLRGKP